MSKWVLDVTDADIEAALERARNDPDPDPPSALSAEYDARLDVIIIRIDNGHRLVIPREEMQGLENATPEQIAEIEIYGGRDICWPQLDLDHYLLHLIEGKYSSEKWRKQREHSLIAA
jgi:hypothetical protein